MMDFGFGEDTEEPAASEPTPASTADSGEGKATTDTDADAGESEKKASEGVSAEKTAEEATDSAAK